jgi:hypothetical protein
MFEAEGKFCFAEANEPETARKKRGGVLLWFVSWTSKKGKKTSFFVFGRVYL